MSKGTHSTNVRRGATGRHTETCLPAAFDLLSISHGLSEETYRTYTKFVAWYDFSNKSVSRRINPSMVAMLDMIAWELADGSHKDMEFRNIRSAHRFGQYVGKLLCDDWRVVVNLDLGEDTNHSVGLVPARKEGYVQLVSNWVPVVLHGVVSLEQVYEKIDHPCDPPRVLYPFNNANVLALPPED